MPRQKKENQTTIKDQVIRLRVTEAEAQLFKANAVAAGCKTISEYIRSRCITDEPLVTGKCVCCGREAKHHVIWGIQY